MIKKSVALDEPLNSKVTDGSQWKRALTMLSLILAGESIFLPAFHLGRNALMKKRDEPNRHEGEGQAL